MSAARNSNSAPHPPAAACTAAPHPPAGTFSPLAGRRGYAAPSAFPLSLHTERTCRSGSVPPSPRLRGEGRRAKRRRGEGPTPVQTREKLPLIPLPRPSPRSRGEGICRNVAVPSLPARRENLPQRQRAPLAPPCGERVRRAKRRRGEGRIPRPDTKRPHPFPDAACLQVCGSVDPQSRLNGTATERSASPSWRSTEPG